jgi:uncharacterized repeat protein (TIGR03803 family)
MTKKRLCSLFAVALLVLVFATASTAASAQTFSVLYNFGTNAGDPANPQLEGIIAQGRDGNLYSTTTSGGTSNQGSVFKITPNGKLTGLYSFDGTNGSFPQSGLTLGADGNFYGAAESGGTFGAGTIFKITPSGSLTVLYSFTNGGDGGYPKGPPVQGTDGNFYGNTFQGGGSGGGTIYKITSSGTLTTLHQFDGTHGSNPYAPLVQGRDGNFYGTTFFGGTSNQGVVFKVTTTGRFAVLYNFDIVHGSESYSSLVQGNDGSFYGTTSFGGSGSGGVIFKITPAGVLTVLHNINGNTDGVQPLAGLVQATDGSFYGTTSGGSLNFGNIFRISPNGSYSVLYDFDKTTGAYPGVTLLQHTNGILYGDTNEGGTGNVQNCSTGICGVFYRLKVGSPPFVSLLSTSGKAGQVVEILGNGLTGTTSVTFGSGSASFTVASDTYVTAIVPASGTTGTVTVTTPSATLKSKQSFKVIPVIASFTPTSGSVGTQVTITGTGLTGTSKVSFGGVKATTFTVNSGTQITAAVPTGAITGKVKITTAGGSATGPGTFTVN